MCYSLEWTIAILKVMASFANWWLTLNLGLVGIGAGTMVCTNLTLITNCELACVLTSVSQQRVGAYSRQRFRVTQVRRACDVMMMPLHNIYHLGVVLV